MIPPPPVRLAELPLPAKWLVTFLLASFLMNHAFAAWLVWEVTTQVDASAKEHFAYKSLAALLRMGHQHAFGHGVMFFLTAALFLLAGPPARLAQLLIAGAFLGAWLDLASWFLLKYSSPRWELLSMAGAGMYTLSFLVMTWTILRSTWRQAGRASSAPT